MKMTTVVRTCMLVTVLAVLGTTTAFGQIIYNVGAPAGTLYSGAGSFNFAVNREGNKELFAPVTVCAAASTGSAAIGAAAGAEFDTGDIYQITFPASAALNSPTLSTLGTLGANNVQVTQAAAGAAATFSAVAAMVQPAAVGGTAPGPPVATITLTVLTGSAAASGVNCITVSNLRFDLGNTFTPAVGSTTSTPDGQIFTVAVTETNEGGGAPAVGPVNAAAALGNPAAPLGANMPAAANVVSTARFTLGATGLQGFANPTGFTTGGTTLSTTTAGINAGSSVAVNPSSGLVASTIISVTQNSGLTGTGTISVQENPIATAPAAGGPNLPVTLGGGLFRGFTASGPDVTTFLNASGATTGTQVEIIVTNIPAGATVTFPATVSSSSGLAVWNMALVGSGVLTSPGGTVTYATTINEGTPFALNNTVNVGPSIDIPFTVAEPVTGGSSGTAKVVIQVGPTTAQGGTPSYSAINGSSVLPSQALTTVGQWALFRIAPNTSTKTYPYVLVAGAAGLPSSYDTGIVLENQGVTVTTGVATPGQSGTFTIYMVGSTTNTNPPAAPTVLTLASTATGATGIPNANQLTSGNLVQGGIWQALASECLKAAGVTTDWRGYFVINANFLNSSGFAFISQFANLNGGATMGYIAQ